MDKFFQRETMTATTDHALKALMSAMIFTVVVILPIFYKFEFLHRFEIKPLPLPKYSMCDELVDVSDQHFFQPVSEMLSAAVYSAYLDIRNSTSGPFIRILGYAPEKRSGEEKFNFFCYIRFKNSASCATVPAKIEGLPCGSTDSRYSDTYFICPVTLKDEPAAVSLITSNSARFYNKLPVNTGSPETTRNNFTVCIAPLHGPYDNIYQLVESVEVNRMLGADFFVIYNLSVSVRVNRILEQLQAEKIIEVVQWSLSNKGSKHLAYFGQVLALNDCLYRSAGRTNYIVQVDLDEFIIPARPYKRWSTWITEQRKRNDSAAVFAVRQAFFIAHRSNENAQHSVTDLAKKFNIMTLLKINRSSLILPFFKRTKYICIARCTITMCVHSIGTLIHGYTTLPIEPEMGFVHHYRLGRNWISDHPEVVDARMLDFKEDISRRVQTRWQNLTNMGL